MDQARPAPVDLTPPSIASGGELWIWLLIGCALLPFTIVQTMIPLAAWLAPIFLLRFSRVTRSGGVAVPAIAVAEMVGGVIATRGGDTSRLIRVLFGYGWLALHSAIAAAPYAAERWIGPRLGVGARWRPEWPLSGGTYGAS